MGTELQKWRKGILSGERHAVMRDISVCLAGDHRGCLVQCKSSTNYTGRALVSSSLAMMDSINLVTYVIGKTLDYLYKLCILSTT